MDNLSTERWTDYKYGNIEYKLRDIERDINEHIPFESLMEELENFIQSIEVSKPFSGFHQFTGEEEIPSELQEFIEMMIIIQKMIKIQKDFLIWTTVLLERLIITKTIQ